MNKEFWTDKKIMVTGGAGFIGSHLVERLKSLGLSQIYILDSLKYGSNNNIDKNSSLIKLILFNIGVDPIEKIKPELEDTDYLFHLAAEKHNQSKDDPKVVLRANIEGTWDLFKTAAECNVKKVLFSSSLYAYGNTKPPAMTETDIPNPWTVYGISKLTAEHMLLHLNKQYNLPYAILRFFFVYGTKQYSGMGYKSVILKNFERMIQGQPPIIFGDGTQVLDYIYVDDVIEAIIKTMEFQSTGVLFNVGSGIPLSISDLTAKMREIAKFKHQETIIEKPDWTQGTFRTGNIDKIKNKLGWSPKIPLNEGLQKVFDWIQGGKIK